ncbi:MAG: cation:proton antiporter [Phycisphaerae bacterium]
MTLSTQTPDHSILGMWFASDALPAANPALMLGLVLLAALVGAHAARVFRLPRVVGYLAAGLALKQLLLVWSGRVAGAAPDPVEVGIRPLEGITDLAMGLVLFFVGEAFERSHLRRVGRSSLRLGLAESGCTFLLVSLACLVTAVLATSLQWNECLPLAVLLGAIAVATAPAATLLVLQEYEAKGPLSETMITMVGINNIIAVVLFHAAFELLDTFGILTTSLDSSRFLILDLTLTAFGSLFLGVALGLLISVFHAKLPGRETLLLFLASVLIMSAGRDWLHAVLGLSFNSLLASIVAGAVFFNVAAHPERLANALHTIAGPIYAAFFVLAGVSLHLGDLGEIGLIGVTYLAARSLGKVMGGRLGTHWAAATTPITPMVGLGMLAQAGVAIALAEFTVDVWGSASADGGFVPHHLAMKMQTIVLGCVVVFELAGPVLTKSLVVRAGEVKAVTLIPRRTAAAESAAPWSEVASAFLRLFRSHAGRRPPAAGEGYCVRDVMRSNVRCLHGDASLNDVLTFIARSRFNHFPVVDADNRCIGVIHFADVRTLAYSPALGRLLTAADMADPTTPVVTPETPLASLVAHFEDRDVGSIPVVAALDTQRIVGIVEQRDVLHVLHETQATPPLTTNDP